MLYTTDLHSALHTPDFCESDAHNAPQPARNQHSPSFQRKGSTRDAARILGCSRSLVRQLIAMGEFRNVTQPGKRTYVLDLDEIEEYRRRNTIN